MSRVQAIALILVGALPRLAVACTLCGGDIQNRSTMRQEAAQARVIVAGTLANARLTPNAADGSGVTDLKIERVLKSDPALGGRDAITIPRYLPADEKSSRFLLLADVVQGRLDVTVGRVVRSDRVLDYLKAVLVLTTSDRMKQLQFFADYLDSPVPEIAADAFLEFAKATDAEVGEASRRLRPERLRALIANPETPVERVRLFALLLGGCGGPNDADFLLGLIRSDSDRARNAVGGLLAGYIVLRPADGWKLAAAIAADPKRGFLDRYAVLGVLRFFRGWRPDDSKPEIRRVLAAAVADGSLADVAIEDLRRWQWWELTDAVLAKFGRPDFDAPMVERAIVRYALSCPQETAKQFVAGLRKTKPALVSDAAESLELDK